MVEGCGSSLLIGEAMEDGSFRSEDGVDGAVGVNGAEDCARHSKLLRAFTETNMCRLFAKMSDVRFATPVTVAKDAHL